MLRCWTTATRTKDIRGGGGGSEVDGKAPNQQSQRCSNLSRCFYPFRGGNYANASCQLPGLEPGLDKDETTPQQTRPSALFGLANCFSLLHLKYAPVLICHGYKWLWQFN
ncbi:hypothetical protein ACLKA6_000325 [Drosophila palustris]